MVRRRWFELIKIVSMIVRTVAFSTALGGLLLTAMSASAAWGGAHASALSDVHQPSVRPSRFDLPENVSPTQVFTRGLRYSTYIDGVGTVFQDVAVDGDGNSVAVGYTTGHSLTLVSAYQPAWSCDNGWPPPQTGVIVKLSPTGDEILFATYFGEGCFTDIRGIALDEDGYIYVAGSTRADNFPLVNAIASDAAGQRGFIAIFSPDGSELLFSTLLGGSNTDEITGIAVGADKSIYVAGTTFSEDFPVKNALYPSHQGMAEGFVAKLNAVAGEWVYITYLGGSRQDAVEGVAVAKDGSVYVTGVTHSSDFPMQNSLGAFDVDNTSYMGFVTRLRADGQALHFSSLLGQTGETHAFAIDVDAADNAYVTGLTSSPDFPVTPGAYQITHPGSGHQVFVVSLSTAGTLRYGTYYGAPGGATYGFAIAVDMAGNAYIAGQSRSEELPPVYPVQQSFGGGQSDALVFKLNPTGEELLFSSYLGSSQSDEAKGIAADAHGGLYIAGASLGADWPTTSDVVADAPAACCGNGVVSRITTLPWTMIFYKAFDNNLTDSEEVTIDVLEQAAHNPHVRIIVLADLNLSRGPIFEDSAYYVIQKDDRLYRSAVYVEGATIFRNEELDTSDPATLANFVTWARTRFPSRHTVLVLSSHGSGVTGAHLDYHNIDFQTTRDHTQMSVKQMGQALDIISNGGQDKVDILLAILCLMGMIEPAYEWRDTADYYIASPHLYLSQPRVLSTYVNAITGTVAPAHLARRIVDIHVEGHENPIPNTGETVNPYTIAIADLGKAEYVRIAVHALGDAMQNFLAMNPHLLTTLYELAAQVQHYDSSGNHLIEPLHDEYVDLYHWASMVHTEIDDPTVRAAALGVMEAVDAYILYHRAKSGTFLRWDWDLSNSYGVGIFAPTSLRSFYNAENFSFLAGPPTVNVQQSDPPGWGWKGFLDTFAVLLDPDAQDNPEPPPLVSWADIPDAPTAGFDLFVPQLSR